MTIKEIMSKAVAGWYGPSFDNCAKDRTELKADFHCGKRDINEPTQEDHLQAMAYVYAELILSGYDIVKVSDND